jgi:hypothetical protein
MTITPLPQVAGFVAPIGGGFWAPTDTEESPCGRPHPESCVGGRKASVEALTGARRGRPLRFDAKHPK